MTTPSNDRSKQIAELTARHLENRWQSRLVWVLLALALALGLLGYHAVGRVGGEVRYALEPRRLVLPSLAVTLALIIVSFVVVSRTLSWARRVAGVSVTSPAPVRSWLRFAYFLPVIAVGPGLRLLLGTAPHWQPLLLAAYATAWTVWVLAVSSLVRGRWVWSPSPAAAAFLCLYFVYGLATGAGLPQPWASSHDAYLAIARLFVPAALAGIAAGLCGEFYSRLQFRRLQRLVNETAPPEGDHGAD